MKLCKIRLIGTKWGGYAPRKRGWYETADKDNGKVMITDAFASTVGATVVGITRCEPTRKFQKKFVSFSSHYTSIMYER